MQNYLQKTILIADADVNQTLRNHLRQAFMCIIIFYVLLFPSFFYFFYSNILRDLKLRKCKINKYFEAKI